MVNRQNKKKQTSYEAYVPLAKGIVGIGLALYGGFSLLCLLVGFKGALFDALRSVMHGLAGCFAIFFAALILGFGLLVARSANRKVSFRIVLFITAILLIVLGIFNMLSRVGDEGFFVDYCIAARGSAEDAASFGSVFETAYLLCSRLGEPGGALGMLLAWPMHHLLGAGGGSIVLIALLIGAVLWLLRFNVGQRFEDLKALLEKWKQKSAQRREQQVQQQMGWEENLAQDPRQLQKPGNKHTSGRPKEQSGVKAVPQQNAAGMQQEAPAAAPSRRKPLWPEPKPDVTLYDEVIVNAVPAVETAEEPLLLQNGEEDAQQQNAAIIRFEEIRKRKAELTGRLGNSNQSAAPADEGGSLVETAFAVKEEVKARRGVPEESSDAAEESGRKELRNNDIVFDDDAEYHPLEDNSSEDNGEETEDELCMPESTTMHTPQFAPLAGRQREEIHQTAKPEENEAFFPVEEEETKPPRPYVFPPVDLLNLELYRKPDTTEQDQENAQKLVKTLSSFGIPAKVQHVTHGPAITRFALGLTASGINVKRLQNITDNIALDLAAKGAIRIESQIPGTNLFGIEVPNDTIQPVTFAQVLLSPEMQDAKSPLAVGLGHDLTGKPIICDLAKMPHLLIAGQTGSGKSVCVNAIINSLLFRSSPEEVRLIMVDPKVVELQCYNCVPHLLIPVVTESRKAAGALAWAVAEMEDRYMKMFHKGVRDLNAYNAKLEAGEPKLPRIVIIIDEFADLMMVARSEVEESIIRIAQKARACGIHMVLATQRPTSEVITGLIKSNVPSRIAFSVASNTDSRNILDKVGAEKLLGYGDMLYMPTGVLSPIRVQGCYLSDDEIDRIVAFIRENSDTEFDQGLLDTLDHLEDASNDVLDDGGSDSEVDDRLEEAIEMVLDDGQASISMLQRRMKVGYARAGRLIDDMAARGIVSKSLGSKPREVLITREEYDRMKDKYFDA